MAVTTIATSCPHCGVGHVGTCPRIKAIEYYENGTVRRIEFHESSQPTKLTVTPYDYTKTGHIQQSNT